MNKTLKVCNGSKKYLFVVSTSMIFGGAEVMLYEFLKRIDRDEFEIALCVLKKGQPLQGAFESAGYKVNVFPVGFTLGGLKSLIEFTRFFIKIKPEIIQSWMYRADFYSCFLKLLRPRTKLIWSVHNCDLSLSRNGVLRIALVKICAWLSLLFPDRIVYCATSAIESHQKFGFKKSDAVFIPNGFDCVRFKKHMDAKNAVAGELALCPTLPVIGCFGRNDPQKNHLGLLDVISKLHGRGLEVYVLMAGEGVDDSNARLVSKTKALGLEKYVRFLGVRRDMPRLMSSLDLYVSFSLGEAFPLVLGEAMLCETPVITTNCGDSYRFALEPWMCVAAGSVDGAVHAIEQFFHLPKEQRKQLGVKSRQFISDQFSVANSVAAYTGLYREVLS